MITNEEERSELAHLNLTAGVQAKASAAYQPALLYFNVGIGFLAEESWQTQYELTLALYTEAAEAAYLSGNFERMESLIEVVLKQAKTLLDKVKVYEIRIQSYIAQRKLTDAMDTGKQVLKMLGVHHPQKPRTLHVLFGLLQTKLTLGRKRIEALKDLPEMTNPYKLAAMRILNMIGSAAYFTQPKLLLLMNLKGINLSLKHGNSPASAYVYAGYGLCLCGFMGDIDSGYRFGRLALSLLEQLNVKEFKARTSFVVHFFVQHWKEHVKGSLPSFLEGYQNGLETGDLEYAAYSLEGHSCYSYFSGQELAELEREVAKYIDIISQLKQEVALHRQQLYRQAVLNLMGQAENPCRLIGDCYNEAQMLPLHQDNTTIFDLYLNKLILCCLFQDYSQALENSALTEKYLDSAKASLRVPLFHFYDSLARLGVYTEVQKSEQRRLLKKVAANQKKMKKWAHHAPMNHQHKFCLVEAERARVLNKDAEAMEYYDRAIAGAKENEYVNEEALALELTAKFYLEKGRERIAQVYMMDARHAYLRWGALAKVKDLDEKYPQLLRKSETAVSSLDDTMTDTTSTGERKGSVLDLSTVMKASQTISGEIVLEKLLQQMMRIVIENAGAEKGFLILEQKGQLMIEAEAIVESGEIRVLQSIPVKGNPEVSEGIINYVARTKERVILNDAAHEGDFRDEPYIVEKQPKSILCIPLIHQGKLSGILYLENNLTTGAFTADRLEVLNLLSAQAAISIENAFFYENLERLVDERTQELSQALEVIEEAKEAAEKELQDAHQMQMSLMPETAPEIEGIEIAGRCIPASTVSGDFFDYLEGKSDNEVAIVIADVTGKAMKGAMNAVMTNGILRAKAEEMDMFSPGHLMTRMNSILKARTERLMNVTMVIGMIDAAPNSCEFGYTLTLANAGHHVLPMIFRDGKIQELMVTGFFPLGVVKDTQYSEEKFQLQSGDVLILMTDGIIEAQDSEENYYSDSGRLENTILQFTQNMSAEAMVDAILNDAMSFGGDKTTRDAKDNARLRLSDDMTVVVAKVQ